MLVSHRHKFIYTKTYKTAGTSVEAYFETFCLEAPDPNPPTEYRPAVVSEAGIVGARAQRANSNNEWFNHMPALAIRQKLGFPIFGAYYKFCNIRNPFDKALSQFFWYDALGKVAIPKTIDQPQRFEQWLQTGALSGDRKAYMIYGKYVLDDVIRYENLTADVERICTKLGLPWQPERLPAFKAGLRPTELSIDEMYTPAARAFIEEHNKLELDLFGYEFPAEAAAEMA